MSEFKEVLYRLAVYYGGEYKEWMGATGHRDNLMQIIDTIPEFTVMIQTPRTMFRFTSLQVEGEPDSVFKERVRYELLWSILQKGVEFVNEQSDIFKMFNPDLDI